MSGYVLLVSGIALILFGNLFAFSIGGPIDAEFSEDAWSWGFVACIALNAIGIACLLLR